MLFKKNTGSILFAQEFGLIGSLLRELQLPETQTASLPLKIGSIPISGHFIFQPHIFFSGENAVLV